MLYCNNTNCQLDVDELSEAFSFFQMVRSYRMPLLQLLESGDIDLCFANEDEASELLRFLF